MSLMVGREREESEMTPGFGLVKWVDDAGNRRRNKEQCVCFWQG